MARIGKAILKGLHGIVCATVMIVGVAVSGFGLLMMTNANITFDEK